MTTKSNLREKRDSDVEVPATQLDKAAWLRAATTAVAEEGMNGLRVQPLAKQLSVTRGSFYWHFTDHGAFVQEFVTHWRDQQLRAVASFEPKGEAPVKAYARLLDTVLTASEAELKRLRVEFAVRGFARRDEFAGAAVAEVDRARTALFIPIVNDFSKNAREAEAFAQLLLVQLSGAQLAIAGPIREPQVLVGLKRAMLASLSALTERATSA
jgi:AcrR family transcriptional regulator